MKLVLCRCMWFILLLLYCCVVVSWVIVIVLVCCVVGWRFVDEVVVV